MTKLPAVDSPSTPDAERTIVQPRLERSTVGEHVAIKIEAPAEVTIPLLPIRSFDAAIAVEVFGGADSLKPAQMASEESKVATKLDVSEAVLPKMAASVENLFVVDMTTHIVIPTAVPSVDIPAAAPKLATSSSAEALAVVTEDSEKPGTSSRARQIVTAEAAIIEDKPVKSRTKRKADSSKVVASEIVSMSTEFSTVCEPADTSNISNIAALKPDQLAGIPIKRKMPRAKRIVSSETKLSEKTQESAVATGDAAVENTGSVTTELGEPVGKVKRKKLERVPKEAGKEENTNAKNKPTLLHKRALGKDSKFSFDHPLKKRSKRLLKEDISANVASESLKTVCESTASKDADCRSAEVLQKKAAGDQYSFDDSEDARVEEFRPQRFGNIDAKQAIMEDLKQIAGISETKEDVPGDFCREESVVLLSGHDDSLPDIADEMEEKHEGPGGEFVDSPPETSAEDSPSYSASQEDDTASPSQEDRNSTKSEQEANMEVAAFMGSHVCAPLPFKSPVGAGFDFSTASNDSTTSSGPLATSSAPSAAQASIKNHHRSVPHDDDNDLEKSSSKKRRRKDHHRRQTRSMEKSAIKMSSSSFKDNSESLICT